jgi:hypothetical protein
MEDNSMQKKKGLVAVFIIFLLANILGSTPVYAASSAKVKLSADATLIRPEKILTVTVNINSTVAVATYEMDIKYDKNVYTYSSCSGVGMTAGELSVQPSSGSIKTVYVDENGGSTPIKAGGANVMTLKFICNKAAKPGDTTFNADVEVVGDANINSIATTVIPLKVSVGSASTAAPTKTPTKAPTKAPTPTPGSNTGLSDVAYLASLKLDKGTLSPAFNKRTYTYNASVANNVTSVNVTTSSQDSKAKVVVLGGSNLKVGSNEIKITVTAEDNINKRNYTIIVKRSSTIGAVSSTPATTPTPVHQETLEPSKTPDSSGSTAEPTTSVDPADPGYSETPSVQPISTDDPFDTPPGRDVDVLGRTVPVKTAFIVGMSLAIIVGVAFGFGFGYYVGRRKSFKSRFDY